MNIQRYFRMAYRVPLALMWTLGVHFFCFSLRSVFYRNRRSTEAIGMWGRGLAAIMGIHIHQVNDPPEEMGDVIIANHMGFWDIPILLHFFPAVFVIKTELRGIPFFGKLLGQQGHVFVSRKDKKSRLKAQIAIERVLCRGNRIIIFPEGKASPGEERLPFAPASLVIARNLHKSVQACVIDYLPTRDLLKWDMSKPTLPQLIDLVGRKRIDASIQFLSPKQVDFPHRNAHEYQRICQQQLVQNRLQQIHL